MAVDDEAIAPTLQKLVQAYPDAAIFLSEAITVDIPEDLQVPYDSQQFMTLTRGRSTVTLNHHPVEQVILELAEQWGMGNLKARIISPKPQL